MKFDQTILHIGPHKTGSTAIQRTCTEHRSRLEDMGILYPLGHWHPQFGSFFCSRPQDYVYNRLAGRTDAEQIRRQDASYMHELMDEMEHTSCQRILLSYEGFIDLDETALLAMRDFLAARSSTATIVAYARAPLEFACSEISQQARFGVLRDRDIAIENRPMSFVLAYKDFLPKFAAVFGEQNVVVRKFLRSDFPQGDVARDFLSFLGLQADVASSGDTDASNAALPAEAVLIGAAIARATETQTTPEEFGIRYSALLARIGGSRITLTTREAGAILSAAKEHLDWLSVKYGIEFGSEEDLVADSPGFFPQDTIDSLGRELAALCDLAPDGA